jgi:hypothetical protein
MDFDLENFENDIHYHWKGKCTREEFDNFLLNFVEDITGLLAFQDMGRRMRRRDGRLYCEYILKEKYHIASWSKGMGWIFKFNRYGVVDKMISVQNLEKGDQFPSFNLTKKD